METVRISGKLSPHANIKGSIKDKSNLTASIMEHVQISGSLSPRSQISGSVKDRRNLKATINVPVFEHHDSYEGDYVVVPKADSGTVLETQGKLMTDDVEVIKIPYFETSNLSGKTVYIASEV
jgi:hypothetical protein